MDFFELIVCRNGILPTVIIIGFARGGKIQTAGLCFIAGDDIIRSISFGRSATLVANYATEQPGKSFIGRVDSGV